MERTRAAHFRVNRRTALWGGVCVGAAALTGPAVAQPSELPRFRYCLNTATIQGWSRPITQNLAIAAKAGYQAVEPWMREIESFVRDGGKPRNLAKQIADLGLSVESAITFSDWLSNDAERNPDGLEAWKRDFDLLAQLGAKRVCAAPGKSAESDLDKIADRYRRLLKLGRSFGVVPQLELWGRSAAVSRLGQVAYVLTESGESDACAALDVFHIYVGGSPLSGLRAFNADALRVFHINDYPADPPREQIGDGQRVFPGDGVAPLVTVLRDLRHIGFAGFLSLELFNSEYWQRDPLDVARTGLEKTQTVVAKAMA